MKPRRRGSPPASCLSFPRHGGKGCGLDLNLLISSSSSSPSPPQSGEIEIVNHKTGDKCNLKFVPYSYFSRDVARKVRVRGGWAGAVGRAGLLVTLECPNSGCPLSRQVTGEVMDPAGKVHFVLLGTWDEKMDCYKMMLGAGDNGAEGRQRTHEAEDSRVLLWKRNPLP